jgi:hypothetical protein
VLRISLRRPMESSGASATSRRYSNTSRYRSISAGRSRHLLVISPSTNTTSCFEEFGAVRPRSTWRTRRWPPLPVDNGGVSAGSYGHARPARSSGVAMADPVPFSPCAERTTGPEVAVRVSEDTPGKARPVRFQVGLRMGTASQAAPLYRPRGAPCEEACGWPQAEIAFRRPLARRHLVAVDDQ